MTSSSSSRSSRQLRSLASMASIASVAAIGFACLAACSTTTEQPPAAIDGMPPGTPGGDSGTTADGQPPPNKPPTTPSDGGSNPTNDAWGPTKCPALPAGKQSGVATGDQLPQLTVKDCDGNDYALENVCGADATWLMVAHGWCPYCRNTAMEAESILAGYAGKNLAAVSVLVQNAQSQPATMADCKAWRDTFKLQNVVVLYDPAGVTLPLFDSPSSALGVYMDKNRIIRSKTVHTDDMVLIKAGIDGALAP